jgi:hypothetical protein
MLSTDLNNNHRVDYMIKRRAETASQSSVYLPPGAQTKH